MFRFPRLLYMKANWCIILSSMNVADGCLSGGSSYPAWNLHEMKSWLRQAASLGMTRYPRLKSDSGQLMRIYLKNNPPKFHTDPISHDSLRRVWRGRPNKHKNNRISSDEIRSWSKKPNSVCVYSHKAHSLDATKQACQISYCVILRAHNV